MKPERTTGNSISLLENGDEFFPRLIEAIDDARSELLIETFIFRDDPTGREVQKALIRAAERGVRVTLTVDGFGSYYLPEPFIEALEQAGVRVSIYHPQPRWLLFRTNIFRRLHRKLVVVDGRTAFIGGINLTYDHVSDSGPDFMVDYAAELRGPVVPLIQQFMRNEADPASKGEFRGPAPAAEPSSPASGSATILFVARNNRRMRTDIERQYLHRIRHARHSIVIANAYFYPGYRMLRALRHAARRGVSVRLLLPGKSDSPLAQHAESTLHDYLLKSGVELYEYLEHIYHGKIAAFDEDWATIGSSNLDPVSLSLNLEANIFVQDAIFNKQIRDHIAGLLNRSGVRKISSSWMRHRPLLNGLLAFLTYHFLRRFPRLMMWFPPVVRDTSPEKSRAALHTHSAKRRD